MVEVGLEPRLPGSEAHVFSLLLLVYDGYSKLVLTNTC